MYKINSIGKIAKKYFGKRNSIAMPIAWINASVKKQSKLYFKLIKVKLH